MSSSAWHDSLFDAAIKAHQQIVKSAPPIRQGAPKEKKMKDDELKLYRITIAPRPAADGMPHNDLDNGCEMLVLGTNGESACAKILDEMSDSPHVSYTRIKISEIKGPFQHGAILDYKPF